MPKVMVNEALRRRTSTARISIFSLLLTVLIFGLVPFSGFALEKPAAKQGVMDLRDYDLQQRGPIQLNGDWRFFPNCFLRLSELQKDSGCRETQLPVPGVWKHSMVNGRRLPTNGYGTYYLKIILGKNRNLPLALKLMTVGTAYRLFAEDRLLASIGRVGRSRAEGQPQFKPLVIRCPAGKNILHLLVQVSNYHYNASGLWFPVTLGTAESIVTARERSVLLQSLLVGIFFVSGLYHLMLFFLRKKEPAPFFFAAICILLGLRQMVIDDMVLLLLFETFPYAWLVKLEYLTYYLVVPLVGLYLRCLFPEELSAALIRAAGIIGAGFTGWVLFTETAVFSRSITLYQIFTCFMIVYGGLGLARAVQRSRKDVWIVLTGAGILFAAAVNDILYAQRLLDTQYCASYGLLGFILSQFFLLSFRFSRSFSVVEALSTSLDVKNRALVELAGNLEEKVAERTREIKEAYRRIEKLALTDALTGLANRRSMAQMLKMEKDRIERSRGCFTIAIFDIDNFKSINDRFGHDGGDHVLVTLSKTLSGRIRRQDKLARWGGEEFLLFFPETDLDGARQIVEKLRSAIESCWIAWDRATICVTATFGICTVLPPATIKASIQAADQALYRGKQQGKNRVCVADTIV